MHLQSLRLHGLQLILPQKFPDDRGYFLETYQKERYQQMGIVEEFVQDNVSFSKKNVLRGLHFQTDPGQAKLVSCLHGSIWDVVVDLREKSDTFGQWEAVTLDSSTGAQLLIPVGFAHGFCVLSDEAVVLYKVSSYYEPKSEYSIRWNDPTIKINWPIKNPRLSMKDAQAPELAFLLKNDLGCLKKQLSWR